jgi:quinol monooxygenase YgiN
MAITALLEITVKADDLEASYAAVHNVLVATRAFAGNQGVDVLVDEKDPAHLVIVEHWESIEHDAAYRAWRAGEGATTELGAVLAGAPKLSQYTVSSI